MNPKAALNAALAMLAAAGTTGAAAQSPTPPAGEPLQLVVERSAGHVTLTVRGNPAVAAASAVSYELDVDGASTVRQRGQAQLAPGATPALARVTINEGAPWRAVLRVDDGKRHYQQVEASETRG